MSFANLSEEFRQKQDYLDMGFDKIHVAYAQSPLVHTEVNIEVRHSGSEYSNLIDPLLKKTG